MNQLENYQAKYMGSFGYCIKWSILIQLNLTFRNGTITDLIMQCWKTMVKSSLYCKIVDIKSSLHLNLAMGLVTSCFSCETVCWRPACCWLSWGTPIKANRVVAGVIKSTLYLDPLCSYVGWANPDPEIYLTIPYASDSFNQRRPWIVNWNAKCCESSQIDGAQEDNLDANKRKQMFRNGGKGDRKRIP